MRTRANLFSAQLKLTHGAPGQKAPTFRDIAAKEWIQPNCARDERGSFHPLAQENFSRRVPTYMHVKTVLVALTSSVALLGLFASLSAALASVEPTASVPSFQTSDAESRLVDENGHLTPTLSEQLPGKADLKFFNHTPPSFSNAENSAALKFPSLAYRQEKNPLPAPWPSAYPTLMDKKLASVLAEKNAVIRSKGTMPIIAPRAGIDYKLTIVAADPTIDPKILIPVEEPPAAKSTRR